MINQVPAFNPVACLDTREVGSEVAALKDRNAVSKRSREAMFDGRPRRDISMSEDLLLLEIPLFVEHEQFIHPIPHNCVRSTASYYELLRLRRVVQCHVRLILLPKHDSSGPR